MSHYSLRITPEDQNDQQRLKKKIVLAVNFFKQNGYLYIDPVISEQIVDGIREQLVGQIQYNDDRSAITNAQSVGTKRFMVPIEIEGKLNEPLAYGHPLLMSLMSMLLGPQYIIDSFGAVVSLPGAERQHVHRDGPHLFRDVPFIALSMPPFAITVAIPLVDLTLETGPTTIISGTHKIASDDEILPGSERTIPAKKGSIVLWDYRTLHSGAENTSSEIRPLLYVTYARPWFRDYNNFLKAGIEPIIMSKQTYSELSEPHQRIFRLAKLS